MLRHLRQSRHSPVTLQGSQSVSLRVTRGTNSSEAGTDIDRLAPINPPRRRSSLGFSQVVQSKVSPNQTQQQADAESGPLLPSPVAQTPNVGKKRGNIASFLRSKKATPGHHANMQKIFQDAKAHLQMDIAFASSPGGSIESRLPSGQTPSLSQASSRSLTARQDETPSKIRDWRYSTAPGLVAQAHIDVREPFPENQSLLPDLTTTILTEVTTPAAEPVSSGFNTPEDHEMSAGETEMDPVLPSLPDTSPMTSRFVDVDAISDRRSSPSPSQQTPLLTNLERPLTEMDIDDAHEGPASDGDTLPATTDPQRQSVRLEAPSSSSEDSGEQPIFLSTPAKAAAESARVKRGLQRSEPRSTSDKENIPPGIICPDPSVHTGRRVSLCPDPHRHTYGYNPQARMSTPSTFGYQSGHSTPNPYFHNYQPSTSPLRASLCPPAPQYRRADSSGSPLPVLKVKSPPRSPGPNTFYQRQSYFSPGQSEYSRPPTSHLRPPTSSGHPTKDAEHFQPGWYHYASEAEPPKPKSLTYAFSTAAAKVVGSSQAPDLRIRDSYRTDTLTPLARPASRFRKNGIGAMVARAGSRPHPTGSYSPWPSITGPGNGRPGTAYPPSRHEIANPNRPQFLSSPPRGSDYLHDMKMRRRQKQFSGDFDIAEDSTAASVPGTPMEIDEDIQAAVRMSISGVPDTPIHDPARPNTAEVRQLSPNVSPFRKGRGMRVNRPRTASYWDQDLPEVRRIDHSRMKRPATMEAGVHRAKSMRVSGIRSSPPRYIEAPCNAVASRSGTITSASVYSQAGLSEVSRSGTRAAHSHDKVGIENVDEVMGETEERGRS
jgi:hypothetical protein